MEMYQNHTLLTLFSRSHSETFSLFYMAMQTKTHSMILLVNEKPYLST